MAYYCIATGGTGSKILEALIYLCAAGLGPRDRLFVLVVDPDSSNGNLDRTQRELNVYESLRSINLGDCDLARTTIEKAKPDTWTPFGSTSNPTLSGFFNFSTLQKTSKPTADLMRVLYSDAELNESLHEGFRGHPSIGAAVMAESVDFAEGQPWDEFRDRVAIDKGAGVTAKVALLGSCFGGTGSSSIPTIGRLVRDQWQSVSVESSNTDRKAVGRTSKLELAAVMMLPYFSFATPEGSGLRAESEFFLLNTQAALEYYRSQNDLKIFDEVYLLGDQHLSPLKNSSRGGAEQRNMPHYLELTAALACVDFFDQQESQQQLAEDQRGYNITARNSREELKWEDIPYSGSRGTLQLRSRFQQLTRFAFAFLSTYRPAIEHIKEHPKEAYKAPWYVEFFLKRNVNIHNSLEKEFKIIKDFCESYLQWFANIQYSMPPAVSAVHLLKADYFAKKDELTEACTDPRQWQFALDRFGELIDGEAPDRHSLNMLWERMCEAEISGNVGSPIGEFVRALYRECNDAPIFSNATISEKELR